MMCRCGVAALVLWAAGSCTKPNPAACCTDDASCSAAGLSQPTGCKDGLVCISNQCTMASGSAQCGVAADCPSTAPICTPSHLCVQCTMTSDCSDTTPVCDLSTGSCVACTKDDDCASAACDLDSGACIASDAIAYASPTGLDTADCSQATPCSLTEALTIATASATRTTVRLLPGDYDHGIVVNGGNPIRVIGGGAHVDDPGANSSVTLQAGANVTIRDLRGEDLYCTDATSIAALTNVVFQSTALASVINACHADLHQVTVNGTLGLGPVNATIDRSAFAGLLLYDGATVTITNSVGSTIDLTAGSYIVTMTMDTFYGTRGLRDNGYTITGQVALTQSIVVATTGTNAVTCAACTVTNNVLSPQPMNIAGNIVDDPQLMNPQAGDFHLRTGSPAIDAAMTSSTDHDFDGVHRPQGVAPDLGAFERAP